MSKPERCRRGIGLRVWRFATSLSPRRLFCWKTVFYQAILPIARRLGPERGDVLVSACGRMYAALWPPRRGELERGATRAVHQFKVGRGAAPKVGELAASSARFAARDCLLDGITDDDCMRRFDVEGEDALRAALAEGRGAVLVGAHQGAYIAALHWMMRAGIDVRFLIQRPRHLSRALATWFDRDVPHPQSSFFLRRGLQPREAIGRVMRARAALRDGLAVYCAGDIPWSGPNGRLGTLFGQSRRYLAVWPDLAALTDAPVFHIISGMPPGGRYRIAIEGPRYVEQGLENQAVAGYFSRLEREIAARPAEAVAHLIWPCYGPEARRPASSTATISARPPGAPVARPSRRDLPLPMPISTSS